MAKTWPTDYYVEEWRSLWEPDLEAVGNNGATYDPTRVDPKVLQWVKKNCSHKPHFVKIVNKEAAASRPGLTPGPTSYCRMRFPTPFAKQHFRMLERVVELENEDGEMWKVAFQSVRRHPTWHQGWFQFSSDNNLKPGDATVFVLVGNSHFRFTQFDEDGNNISHNSTIDVAAIKKQCTSYSSEDSDSMWDAEDEHVKIKRAPPSLAKKEQAPSRKRRRLCKVGEKLKEHCFSKGNLAVNNNAHNFEGGGSISMAKDASTVRL